MINQILQRLTQLKFTNFCTIYFGLKFHLTRDLITIEFVKKFALEELSKSELDGEHQKLIVDVLISDDVDEILDCLRKVNGRECSELIAKKKWLLAELSVLLDSLNTDPVYALIELSDFWIKWGYEDCPHIFQGVNNCMAPDDYYTDKNYESIFRKNLNWLNEEIENLSGTINGTV